MSQIDCLSLVMPCFNEQEAIPVVLPRVLHTMNSLKQKKSIKEFEVIVVNDQSTDHSLQRLSEFQEIKVVNTIDQPRGYGSALKEGFTQSKGDWLVFMDVDNSYRPEDLRLFVEEINKGQFQFIMGQRPLREKGMSFIRGLGNWFYGFVAGFMYSSPVNDVCCGYRAFHRRHLPDVVTVPEQGLDFSIHLTMKMIVNQIQFKPVRIQYDPRVGESKLSVVKDGLAFLKVLLLVKAGFIRDFKHRRVW